MTDKRIEAALTGMYESALQHTDGYETHKQYEIIKAALAAADAVDTEKQELIDVLREAFRLSDESVMDDMEKRETDLINWHHRTKEILAKHGGKNV